MISHIIDDLFDKDFISNLESILTHEIPVTANNVANSHRLFGTNILARSSLNRVDYLHDKAAKFFDAFDVIEDQFNNPIYSEKSVADTYNEHITNNADKKLFNNKSQFAHRKNNICVNLSDLLTQNKFVDTVNKIVEYHAIAPINSIYVKLVHKHWLQCHDQDKL